MAGDSADAPEAFGQRLRRDLGLGADHVTAGKPDAVEYAAQVVRSYCTGGYTGAVFDTYASNDPARITSDDLIAMSLLSIPIREQSTSSLPPSSILTLDSLTGRITELLSMVPDDRELHTLTESEFGRWLDTGSPGDQLYWLLRNDAAIPRVAVYKLMARKRLALMPIRDTVVEKALGQKADPWWRPWWETLATGPDIVDHLDRIRKRSEAGHLSLLRIADIVLWMTHRPSRTTKEAG